MLLNGTHGAFEKESGVERGLNEKLGITGRILYLEDSGSAVLSYSSNPAYHSPSCFLPNEEDGK